MWALPGTSEIPDQRDQQDQPVQMDSLEILVLRDQQVTLDQSDHPVHQEVWAQLEQLESKVGLVQRVLQVVRAFQEVQEIREHKVIREIRVLKDQQVQQDLWDSQDPAVT